MIMMIIMMMMTMMMMTRDYFLKYITGDMLWQVKIVFNSKNLPQQNKLKLDI